MRARRSDSESRTETVVHRRWCGLWRPCRSSSAWCTPMCPSARAGAIGTGPSIVHPGATMSAQVVESASKWCSPACSPAGASPTRPLPRAPDMPPYPSPHSPYPAHLPRTRPMCPTYPTSTTSKSTPATVRSGEPPVPRQPFSPPGSFSTVCRCRRWRVRHERRNWAKHSWSQLAWYREGPYPPTGWTSTT